jgi:hypothetical protein
MTASIFSHLPNILIMNIIKMNTESCRIEKEIALTKEKMNTCFPFIENNELYGWDTTKGETPFDNINFEGYWDNAFGVVQLYLFNLFNKDETKTIQVWGFTEDMEEDEDDIADASYYTSVTDSENECSDED